MGRSLDDLVAVVCADVAARMDWDSLPGPDALSPSAVAVALREDVATAGLLNEEWAERGLFTPERLERFRSRLSAFALFAVWLCASRHRWDAEAPETCRERAVRLAHEVSSDPRLFLGGRDDRAHSDS